MSDFFGCEYDSLNGLKLKTRSSKVGSADKNAQKLQVDGKDKNQPNSEEAEDLGKDKDKPMNGKTEVVGKDKKEPLMD